MAYRSGQGITLDDTLKFLSVNSSHQEHQEPDNEQEDVNLDNKYVFGYFLMPARNFQSIIVRGLVHLYKSSQRSRGLSASHTTSSNKALNRYCKFLAESGCDWLDRKTWRDYTAYLFNRGLGKSGIASIQSYIRSFYQFLQEEEIIKASPFSGLSSPKLDKRLPSFLSLDEIHKLLDAPDTTTDNGQRDHAILDLFYSSGMRLSELIGLDVADLNLTDYEVRVFGKGSKERICLFGKPACRALSEYLAGARRRSLNGHDTPALFLNCQGSRLSRREVERLVSRYGLDSLNKRVHPHMLRHTFATHMLDGGANLRVIQELMGHENLATTAIYTHTSMVHLREDYMKAHPLCKY